MPRNACHALVPAAGCGARMGGAMPKQYQLLAGKPMIYHALQTLCEVARIEHVFVVLSVDDELWSRYDWSCLGSKLVPLFCGGATRADTVRNALRATAAQVDEHDWMLVHDAARPCLATWHVDTLMDGVLADGAAEGGILAVPVADTLKRADATEHIEATIARRGLWQAQTPQMFRHGALRRALESVADLACITDEASAMELQGARPCLVMSEMTNLKVTYPLDLRLAEWILQHR
ncbi:MAG: 2-C-methyl-D-erythritol 4-phosphate cytidylyltransferase [Sterolibacterium sp.]|nr:2-C-methyl-D-erythritol 4-phosphate cytidylyltransferase [Sterolibacterium sp.]